MIVTAVMTGKSVLLASRNHSLSMKPSVLPEDVGLSAPNAAISRDRAKLAKLGAQPAGDRPDETRLQIEERLQKTVTELFMQ